MGLFSSRMTPAQLAQAKGQGRTTRQRNQLADAANGYGVSRAAKNQAQAALAAEVGAKGAQKLMNQSKVRWGAKKPSLTRRLFG